MNCKKILILGGDKRIVSLANNFNRDGFDVVTYGFSEDIDFDGGIVRAANLTDALSGRDVVISGLPVTVDDITLHTPLYEDKIYLYDILKLMTKEQLFVGGRITPKVKNLCGIYNISVTDYFEREELAVANAVPTAEGAIELAMNLLPVTVWRSKSLVLGFGRIGKILSSRLNALGAETYVEARKFSDLAWIDAYGNTGIPLNNLKGSLPQFDVIYNTVPHEILTEDMLKLVRRDCLIIDLASAPGGVDIEKAARYGIKVVHALSLPGKVAPETAGEIIKDTILNIFADMGV